MRSLEVLVYNQFLFIGFLVVCGRIWSAATHITSVISRMVYIYNVSPQSYSSILLASRQLWRSVVCWVTPRETTWWAVTLRVTSHKRLISSTAGLLVPTKAALKKEKSKIRITGSLCGESTSHSSHSSPRMRKALAVLTTMLHMFFKRFRWIFIQMAGGISRNFAALQIFTNVYARFNGLLISRRPFDMCGTVL